MLYLKERTKKKKSPKVSQSKCGGEFPNQISVLENKLRLD